MVGNAHAAAVRPYFPSGSLIARPCWIDCFAASMISTTPTLISSAVMPSTGLLFFTASTINAIGSACSGGSGVSGSSFGGEASKAGRIRQEDQSIVLHGVDHRGFIDDGAARC